MACVDKRSSLLQYTTSQSPTVLSSFPRKAGSGGYRLFDCGQHSPNTTLALWKHAERSACGNAGNDKESQAERTVWR
jgi:hypothetical protein